VFLHSMGLGTSFNLRVRVEPNWVQSKFGFSEVPQLLNVRKLVSRYTNSRNTRGVSCRAERREAFPQFHGENNCRGPSWSLA
jgi:hypothetical protein